MALRYIVERISDGRMLELDLPLTPSKAGKALMGPGALAGVVAQDNGGLRLASGELLADQGKSFIHEEVDGVIRNTWLVTYVGFPDVWKIEGEGFSAFLNDRPYEGEYRGIGVDLADVVRHIWQHAQRYSSSNIGVTVTGSTGVKRGTDSDEKYEAAKALYESRKKALKVVADQRKAKAAEIKKKSAPFDKAIKLLNEQKKPLQKAYQALIDARKPYMDAYRALTKQRTARRAVYDGLVKTGATAAAIAAAKAQVEALTEPIADARALVDARKPAIDAAKAPVDAKNEQIKLKRAEKVVAVESLQAQHDALKEQEEPLKQPVADAKEALDKAREKQLEDGGAWKILWWDTPECASEVQAAIDEAGFEWVEWSGWNADRSKILKEIRIVKRVGRKQNDLRFVEGVNITKKVVLESDASEYANTVTAIGAGEGKAALRVTVGVDDGRVRKVHVLDAKHVTQKSVLEKLARAELATRSQPMRISAISVDASHKNAPKGTFGVGDTILVDCEVSWLPRKPTWERITEIEWTDENNCDIFFGV